MNLISEALSLYVGYGITSFPKEDVSRLKEKFDSDVALRLEKEIKLILEDLDSIKPDWKSHSLVSGSKWAVEELRHLHPELNSKAVEALEWIFSWWRK